ncbi:MAG TPA: ComF family protein [Edaphocola sp.]|nr:ComF family protein [Edaphocola sp.]
MKSNLLHILFDSFYNFLLPKHCAVCERSIGTKEAFLCLKCFYDLPYTEMQGLEENPISINLLTKLKIENSFALLYFVEGGTIRKLLHQMKYGNRPEIGLYLGKLMGRKLLESNYMNDIDIIVPIPLHKKKKHLRGYNQSDYIAEGLALEIKKPVNKSNVVRVINTNSQTDKNRAERLKNVANAFKVKDTALFSNKHLLLIDDVFTTGATIASCGNAILKDTNCKISVATIALPVE